MRGPTQVGAIWRESVPEWPFLWTRIPFPDDFDDSYLHTLNIDMIVFSVKLCRDGINCAPVQISWFWLPLRLNIIYYIYDLANHFTYPCENITLHNNACEQIENFCFYSLLLLFKKGLRSKTKPKTTFIGISAVQFEAFFKHVRLWLISILMDDLGSCWKWV